MQRSEGFGAYLRTLRKQNNLSMAEAARRLGLKNRQRLWHYESGRTVPSGPLLIKLAQLYKVRPDEVLKRAYWPQLILLPLISIINPEQLPEDLVEKLVEDGLKEEGRRDLTQQIEKLLRRQSRVGQHT